MRRSLFALVGLLVVGFGLDLSSVVRAESSSKEGAIRVTDQSRTLAKKILDEGLPRAEREAVVKDHPGESAELIAALVEDLEPGTAEEYRRIPWIWQVAIAGGRRNESRELVRLLEVSLPAQGGRLEDWRAVVIGGGLINGVSLVGVWPAARFDELLDSRADLKTRWQAAIERASAMADDEKVKTGTRYDALRMLGVESWDRRGGQLFRYLLKGVHPELQQGAVSGLADVPSPCVGPALLVAVNYLTPHVQNFALDALIRDEGRIAALLDAVADGRLDKSKLGAERIAVLLKHPNDALKRRAGELLGQAN